jgi:hypothetical protein
MKDYMWPAGITEDAAGRKLDAAGKLVKQTARPELKKTGGVDPDRMPEFKKFKRPPGAPG